MVIISQSLDGESYEVLAWGKEVARVNHDEHGWAGIDATLNAVRNLCKEARIELREM